MAGIYQSITELVGRTPLLQLNGYNKANGLQADVIGKLEYFNPNQSVKDRIALADRHHRVGVIERSFFAARVLRAALVRRRL